MKFSTFRSLILLKSLQFVTKTCTAVWDKKSSRHTVAQVSVLNSWNTHLLMNLCNSSVLLASLVGFLSSIIELLFVKINVMKYPTESWKQSEMKFVFHSSEFEHDLVPFGILPAYISQAAKSSC